MTSTNLTALAEKARQRYARLSPEQRERKSQLRNARRRALNLKGLCRMCRKPSDGRIRCKSCQRAKAVPELAGWVRAKKEMRDYLSCESGDRRQRGRYTRALDWALVQHRLRFAEEEQ